MSTRPQPPLPPSFYPGPVPLLSLVIPAYNEEARLGRTLTEILRYLDADGSDVEVFVVNDGSRDRTPQLVESFRSKSGGRIRLLSNPGNRGKGFAVRHGVMNATGEVIVFFDADLATPLQELPKIVDPILAQRYDVVVGSRAVLQRATQPLHRRVMSRVLRELRAKALGLGFEDTQCGFKALRREAAHAIFGNQSVEGFAFDIELLLLAHAQRWRVAEVPIEWEHQPGSTVQPLRASLGMLKDIIRMRMGLRRRRHQRQPFAATIRVVQKDGTGGYFRVHNLTPRGMYLTGPLAPAVGSRITLLLSMPEGTTSPLYARVVHGATKPSGEYGMGVEFRRFSAAHRQVLERFIASTMLKVADADAALDA